MHIYYYKHIWNARREKLQVAELDLKLKREPILAEKQFKYNEWQTGEEGNVASLLSFPLQISPIEKSFPQIKVLSSHWKLVVCLFVCSM